MVNHDLKVVINLVFLLIQNFQIMKYRSILGICNMCSSYEIGDGHQAMLK